MTVFKVLREEFENDLEGALREITDQDTQAKAAEVHRRYYEELNDVDLDARVQHQDDIKEIKRVQREELEWEKQENLKKLQEESKRWTDSEIAKLKAEEKRVIEIETKQLDKIRREHVEDLQAQLRGFKEEQRKIFDEKKDLYLKALSDEEARRNQNLLDYRKESDRILELERDERQLNLQQEREIIDSEVVTLLAKFEREKNELEKDLEKQLQDIRASCAEQRERLTSEQESEIQSIRSSHEVRKERLAEQHQGDLAEKTK